MTRSNYFCIINVLNNFVPRKTIIFKDNKDPPWMYNKIRQLCQNKAKIYKTYVKRGFINAAKEIFRNITNFSANIFLDAKTRYLSCISSKLNNPQKTIPLIPPLLVNISFITNIFISTRMIHICDDSILLPLAIIFKTALNSDIYPDQWKKENVVPVHKKRYIYYKLYIPISLLPICGKIF